MFFRQKLQLALCAHAKAFAKQTAGAERDFRLQDVVAFAQRIGIRIDKSQQAALLIIVQMVPRKGQHDGRDGRHDYEFPPSNTSYEEHRRACQHQQHCRAKVGLEKNQANRCQGHQNRRDQNKGTTNFVGFQTVEIFSEDQNQGDLHKLRRLDNEKAQIDPSLRAHPDLAHDLHDNEQEEHDEIEGVGPSDPESDIDKRQQKHQRKADKKTDGLRSGPWVPAFAARGIEQANSYQPD